MLEEIFTGRDEKDETFDVGERIEEIGNFAIYELMDERGRLLNYSCLNKEVITKS